MTEEDDSTHHTARSPERVGYRLGFEAAKELIANELETVRSYQGRSIVLLSVTALVAGIGIRGSGGADFASATTGGLLAGWLILAVGLLSSLVGAVCLNRPLKGAFDPLPKPFVTRFGDDEANQYPTNDDAYRAMALEGAKASDDAVAKCRKRYPWLWASLAGPPVALIGLATLWANAY